MRRFKCVLLLAIVFAACSSSKKNDSTSLETLKPEEGNHRLAINVNLDGDLHEWPEPLPGYSKETTLHFGVTNNKDYLFIAVACSDERMQRKMLRTGMEIYISENGKKETLTGIEFPLPSTRRDRQPEATGVETPQQNSKDNKTAQSAELTQLQTFGLKKTADGKYPLVNESGCKVAYSWGDNNFFNIEYAIPLKEVSTVGTVGNSSSIQVGFKLNGFSNKENGGQRGSYATNSRAGGMRSAGGMRGGGMRGGGMRGGGMRQNGQGMNNISEMAKDQSFWTKYTIS